MNNTINFGEYKWIKGKTGNNNNSLGSHPIMKNCFVLWHKIFLEFTKNLLFSRGILTEQFYLLILSQWQ